MKKIIIFLFLSIASIFPLMALDNVNLEWIKKDEAIKRIANEAGMPPRLAVGIMNRPIISQINNYFMNAKKAEPASSHTSSDSWTCKMCGTDNDGNFCKICGAKRP